MITEDYVSFETAKLLKEKGFDEPCNNIYYEILSGFNLGLNPGYTNSHWENWYKDMGVRNYSAPTLQMAMKWLRETHNYAINVNYIDFLEHGEVWSYAIIYKPTFVEYYKDTESSYKLACEAAIKYCLENLI